METKDIIEYANRNWEQVSEMDYEYWKTAYRDGGFKATQNASFALWRHLKSIRPDWPNSRDRQCDLEHHIKLNKLLDQASLGMLESALDRSDLLPILEAQISKLK